MVFQRGTSINLIQRFWTIDPVNVDPTTGLPLSILANPTTVVFTVTSPDGVTELVYTFGVDANILNPDTGIFVCTLDPQLPTGIYHFLCVGTGAVAAQSEDDFEISESAVETPDPPPMPVQGPCYPWINGMDVAKVAQGDYDNYPWVFDTAAYNASQALYEISGRQFPGVCTRIVRPCPNTCGCWFSGPVSYGMGPWYWNSAPWGGVGGWMWGNEFGNQIGCSPLSRVRLAGYPVHQINQVLLDGVELPEYDPDTGARNWRLDGWRFLTRMSEPGDPSQPRYWPSCQNMSLDSGNPGTFAISYQWGQDVPQLGKAAAMEIANQLFLAFGGNSCQLPAGVTTVTRQGLTLDRQLLAAWTGSGPTGLVNTDLFLQAYCYGQKRGRRSAVYSPDLQMYGRSLGIPGTSGNG